MKPGNATSNSQYLNANYNLNIVETDAPQHRVILRREYRIVREQSLRILKEELHARDPTAIAVP